MRYVVVVAALCVALAGCATSHQRFAGCTTNNQNKLARCMPSNQRTAFNDSAIDQPVMDQSWSSDAYSSNASSNWSGNNAHTRGPDQAGGRPSFDAGGGNRHAMPDSPRTSSAGGGRDFSPPSGGRGHDFTPSPSGGREVSAPVSSGHDYAPRIPDSPSARIPDSPSVASAPEPSSPPAGHFDASPRGPR